MFNALVSVPEANHSDQPHRHDHVDIPTDHVNQTFNLVERHALKFRLGGYLFKETGRTYYLEADLTSCLIHSFSPYVEREAAKRFLDPAHDNIYFANSPAVVWYKGEVVLITRIWLDREKYEPKSDWPANHFADNFLYTQKFDSHMRPVSAGHILGIPSPKQWWVGDGPIEPRVFVAQNRLFVSFNAAMAFKQMYYMDFTVMWDYDRNIPILPHIKGGTPMVNVTEPGDMPRDKHWMALLQKDDLYFVHNLDPLRVLHCELDGQCEFVHKEEVSTMTSFDSFSHLRGGTPFELYEWPYYISVAHSTLYKSSSGHRYYTAHLVVLCVKPWRIVYVSDDLKVHDEVYKQAPMVRPRYIDDGFVFPVGIILENPDWMSLGVHVNDYSSVLLRFKGMKPLMRAIMMQDKLQGARTGPPAGYIQKHIHETQQNLTKLEFVHSWWRNVCWERCQEEFRCWKPWVAMMSTLSSLTAPQVVTITTRGVASDWIIQLLDFSGSLGYIFYY